MESQTNNIYITPIDWDNLENGADYLIKFSVGKSINQAVKLSLLIRDHKQRDRIAADLREFQQTVSDARDFTIRLDKVLELVYMRGSTFTIGVVADNLRVDIDRIGLEPGLSKLLELAGEIEELDF